MRLRARDITSKMPTERVRDWLRRGELRERWENRPEWLRSERAQRAWQRRPSWLRSREWYEEVEVEHVLKGALAGAIGGLVGSWVMAKAEDLFQRSGIQGRVAERTERQARPAREYAEVSAGERQSQRFGYVESAEERGEWRTPQRHEIQEEPATEKLAHTISRRVLRRELSPRGKQIGGQVVHYGYGAAMGAIYGGAAEVAPRVTTGLGMPAAAVMWALGDEIAVSALRLRKHPREYPLSQHATFLGMHLVYGAATELIRRTLRRMLD